MWSLVKSLFFHSLKLGTLGGKGAVCWGLEGFLKMDVFSCYKLARKDVGLVMALQPRFCIVLCCF